ncbi:MAG: xanthine dehydrogenase family protein subunit M [Chloroflexia bacterium]|jgi:carbon-monoxide dehydrogenase medium subunit|nr:xanthine dehydrogenase family protein subunit M [Chloroflexia bacterium]
MYPAAFDYHRPGSVQEAISLLQENPEAKILAGGHSLLPAMKLRLAEPGAIVDLGSISDLKQLSLNGGATIGAMCTYDALLNSNELETMFPVLHEALAWVGDVQVRNLGTIGGSAAHADPAADIPAALVALEAEFVVVGPNGERTIPASEFFIDIFTTALEPEEVLTQIKLSAPDGNVVSAYEKFPHPASGYPVCGVAVVVTRDGSGNVSSARITATGSVYVVTRLTGAEDALTGTGGDASAVEAASERATEGVSEFAGDHYASSEYREHLTKVFVKRALNRALGN